MRRAALRRAVACAALTVLAISCTSGGATVAPVATLETAPPQPLTAGQATLLAGMRLANYRVVEASFTTSVRVGVDVIGLSGVVNWKHHTGSAVFKAAGRTDASAHGLMQWNFDKVAAHAGGDVDGPPPPPPADSTWTQRPIDPTQSALDTVFLLLLSLAAPQPENPQLLRQTDAVYLGVEIVDGQTVTVFSGPSTDSASASTAPASSASAERETSSRLTYWVAADGVLLRLRAIVGNQIVTVDFAPSPATPTEYLPDLIDSA